MNLVLDFGNTRIKAGLFDGKELRQTLFYDSSQALIQAADSLFPLSNCIIGTVTNDHLNVYEFFNSKCKTVLFSAQTPIPLKNLYKSALTLGSDRIAASVGSWSLYPDQNVLTIDAGTCIKYNFVNAKNEYLGGAISPGIPMRLRAMHHYTQALPLIEVDKNYEKLIGQSTAESLLSGAQVAAVCEVDALISRYIAEYKDLQVVITGGDADYLCKQLKNRFFAHQTILLLGLNTILNYSLEN